MFCKIVVSCNPMWDGPNVLHDIKIKIKLKHKVYSRYNIFKTKSIHKDDKALNSCFLIQKFATHTKKDKGPHTVTPLDVVY